MLDLFSGEGGAGAGYHAAGWDVYSVDNSEARLSRNPFPSHLGDMADVMAILIWGGAADFRRKDGRVEWLTAADFAAIHASPTCTGCSRGTAALPDRFDRYDRLIGVTRELLIEVGKPYVIENVEDALPELRTPLLLCWSMFREPGSVIDADGTPLTMRRHRLFESNVMLTAPGHCRHPRDVQVAGAYGGARRNAREAREVRKGGYVPKSVDVLRDLIGAPWMGERGLFLSIPPAYTNHIGLELMSAIS